LCALSLRGFLLLFFLSSSARARPRRFGGIGVEKNELLKDDSSRVAFFSKIDEMRKEKERKKEEENESLTMPTPAIVMVVSGFGKDGIFTRVCVCIK
jgi:hypothetical protein